MKPRFLNIDFHISVIADVINIIGDKIDIVNLSMSGHNWVLGKENANLKIINDKTWKGISQEMIDAFVKEYDDLLKSFDGFIVTHTPVLALLYEKYNKPVIIVNSCRYEQPFCWNHNSHGFEWLNSKLNGMKHNLFIVSNNKADQEHLKKHTGLDSIHIPSLCLYTNEKYTGSTGVINRQDQLRRGYTWQGLYSSKAILHVPYEISTMSIFEQYSANVPMLFPSKQFLKKLVHDGSHRVNSIYGPYENQNIEWWIDRADFYDEKNMPYIIYFNSEDDLNEKIKTVDFQQVSKLMGSFNEIRERSIKEKWERLLQSI